MPTYAITGAAGYLGTRMTRHLLDADPENRVIGFDVRPARLADPRLELHLVDVRDPQLAARLVGRDVAALLHFAFVLDPLYDEREMHEIDVGGTRNVLDAVVTAKIPHLLATSSTTAYGALPDNPVPLAEDAPLRARPEFAYAHDKKLMDEMLAGFAADHPEIAVCVIRPCIVLGPTVANYIATTLLRQPVTSLLDGADPPIQFVHEDDVVRLVALCVARRAAGVYDAVGEGTLLASEVGGLQGKRTLRVPYRLARAIVWALHRLRVTPFALPPGILDFFRYPWVASGEKARRELGFAPEHSSRACFDIILARRAEILAAFAEKMKARGRR